MFRGSFEGKGIICHLLSLEAFTMKLNVKKKRKHTLSDEGKVKISYFFLPCFAHRLKLRPGEVFFFTLARVFCLCD